MKVLISTLNYNLPELTDNTVDQIKQSKFQDYELMIVDNGSDKNLISKYTTHQLENNIFFGGGLNKIIEYFLDNTDSQYLFVLNNDLIFHGYNFIEYIINRMEQFDIDIYSPSIINAQPSQCHWKQMHCWFTNSIRKVKWFDFQCPIFTRKFLEKQGTYPWELIYGWGNDLYTGIFAEENEFNIAVDDTITITHLEGQTFKQKRIDIKISDFCSNAEAKMFNYFNNSQYKERFYSFRKWAENYTV